MQKGHRVYDLSRFRKGCSHVVPPGGTYDRCGKPIAFIWYVQINKRTGKMGHVGFCEEHDKEVEKYNDPTTSHIQRIR